MIATLKISLRALLLFTLLTGVLYPVGVTALAQLLFPRAATGSLVERDGHVVGSSLVAQAFTSPRYFHPRPSAVAYDAAASGGSNLATTNPAQAALIRTRTASLAADGAAPVELLTASGSGLDPHISPEAARFQVARVAAARGLAPARVLALVDAHVELPLVGLFGAARVNVLQLDLALDALDGGDVGREARP